MKSNLGEMTIYLPQLKVAAAALEVAGYWKVLRWMKI
jgi:hypothetical protein